MAGKPGTFSILAISENPKLVGVAVASGSTLVGARVPHAKPGVGAVATQAYTNIAYGVEGLRLLEMGFSPAEVLNKMLAEDSERELRQVAFIDFVGRKAVFTGSNVPWFRGEVVGEKYIVLGNFLKNSMVLKSMAVRFENSSGDLALQMAEALRAGSESGGDKRGEKSAALIVVSNKKVEVNLRVDFHENPVKELLRQLETGLS
ncbi:MAG: DUF1028 domain-containing protein [Candidatus Bathyarchaeales archaeon]